MPADTPPLNQLLQTFRSDDGYENYCEIFRVHALSIFAIAPTINSVTLMQKLVFNSSDLKICVDTNETKNKK